jgi:DtxR family Mn-dependent transcriptional regulator
MEAERARAQGTSPSVEKYIEAIAHLLTNDKVCTVKDIAEVAQVSRPAASRAVRDLVDRNLAVHKSYSYVDLTEEGRALADRLAARHEALYRFLHDVLGYDDEEADTEACRLEHQLDDETVQRLQDLRDFLTSDPDILSRWCSKRDDR